MVEYLAADYFFRIEDKEIGVRDSGFCFRRTPRDEDPVPNIIMISTFNINKSPTRVFIAACLFFIAVGCLFRLWHINRNEFVFYDEGFYLNHNRAAGEMIRAHYPLDTENLRQAFRVYMRTCLASGKSLWFMIADARIFFGAVHQWFWARVMAALCGILTLFVTYCFACRFFQSRWTAWIALALLAVLPSHVFYSRLGMQETLSTLLVLLGFYFYLFPRTLTWRTFVSGVFFGLAFFSNYRLIMVPVLVGVAELWMSIAERRWFDLRRYIWCVLMFLCMVFGVGGTLFGGINTYIIFSWIFHQQHLAQGEFHWMNFLIYPYNLFRLENWTFAVIFFASGWVVFKRDRRMFLPFVLVLVQMILFSLPEEKGARYLCVVLPFAVMSAAYLVELVYVRFRSRRQRTAWIAVCLLMAGLLSLKSYRIAESSSNYQAAAEYVLDKGQDRKFVSTQKFVQDLYAADPEQVKEAPSTFEGLAADLSQGYHYLIIGPQAYMSFPEGGRRFSQTLGGPYEFIRRGIEPVRVYDHFNATMIERFVLEHSSSLLDSTEFLRLAASRGYGKLYIYDLRLCVPIMMKTLMRYQQRQEGGGDG